ncbi:MAG: site-2 protease family protein [Selenomonadaceae bacterium]
MFGPDMIFAIPGLLLAMTIHEYAHARVAVAMGDFTPRMTGRLTLNPVAHIDPIGLLMLFFAQFGWAKPVMINARNFKDWRKGELYVSLAGPAANLVTAFIALLLLAAVGGQAVWLYNVLKLIVLYNINFAVFNMIPLPPLDGSKVLMSFLPGEWAYKLAGIERYSFLILIVLVFTNVLGMIIFPIRAILLNMMSIIVSLIF